jgi:N-acetylglutamate synthase-like GNAT family acetyltransferase
MPGMTSVEINDRERLARLEEFYDAVPRGEARAEDHGPLTLFVRAGEGWPFYARPALGWSGAVRVADVDGVRARQRELGVPESFEWVAETTPGLRAPVEESGLAVHEHPLMVLGTGAVESAEAPAARPPARILDPDDPALPGALAVPHLAFAEPGTGVGTAGPAELAEAVRARNADGSLERAAERIRSGRMSVAAAVDDGGTVLCSGQYNLIGETAEIVGVGTLPTARRRGLALAVTAVLVADARSRGAETVFLSAGDDDVARIYARLGFRRVGTALIAEPAG